MIFLLWPALVGLSPDQCSSVAEAHQKLLDSSFSVERQFRMSVNGDLKKREVARLFQSEGQLETEVLEDEVLSKNMVFESEGKDFALDSEFTCGRVRSLDDGRWELASEDGLETVVFEMDEDRNALRPVAWTLDTTERFLFKKFVVEGRVEYSNFEWR